jgi:hypothetical protein
MTNRADIALVMKGRQSVFLSESATNLKRKDEGKVTATLCINAATSEISTGVEDETGDILQKSIIL